MLAARAGESLEVSLEVVRLDLDSWHSDESFTDDFSILRFKFLADDGRARREADDLESGSSVETSIRGRKYGDSS